MGSKITGRFFQSCKAQPCHLLGWIYFCLEFSLTEYPQLYVVELTPTEQPLPGSTDA